MVDRESSTDWMVRCYDVANNFDPLWTWSIGTNAILDLAVLGTDLLVCGYRNDEWPGSGGAYASLWRVNSAGTVVDYWDIPQLEKILQCYGEGYPNSMFSALSVDVNESSSSIWVTTILIRNWEEATCDV